MVAILEKFFAAILAFLQMIFSFGGYDPGIEIEKDEQPYPYVFVHGFAGWGCDDGLTNIASYWGSFNGDLTKFLSDKGCECYNSSCGPFSSAWDRACELYAQLVGATVDYGEAHAAKFGHDRYGKTYEKPLFEGWSQTKKVNLIAHSFGGNTVRLLADLLADGSDEEKALTSDGTLSPLFAGDNSGMIYSITTLASPHNGTTLTSVLDTKQGSDFLKVAYYLISAMGSSPVSYFYNLDLGAWGVTGSFEDFNVDTARKLAETADTGVYDLTIKGSAELNSRIDLQDDIYYYSYAGCSTKENPLTGHHIPTDIRFTSATAVEMGRFSGEVDGYTIDSSWYPNDGVVNTISAIAPFNDAQVIYNSANVAPGIWNIMPTQNIDHLSFTMGNGLTAEKAAELADFVIGQINCITTTYNF